MERLIFVPLDDEGLHGTHEDAARTSPPRQCNSSEEDAMTRAVAEQMVETLASGERIYGIAGDC
jgi:hypothetical protein